MAELNQQQVVDYIKGISVLELSQLVKALEQELGVSAAAATGPPAKVVVTNCCIGACRRNSNFE